MARARTDAARDPVCGFDLTGVKNATTLTVRGTRRAFCGTACRDRFRKDPARFSGTPLLRLDAVKKSYRLGTVDTPVLRGFDLNVWAGDFVVIVGASGSGKSTLLNMLGLLDRPTAGRISIRGVDAQGLSEDARAAMRSKSFGFIFQQYNLIPWLTAYENAVLPLLFAGREADRPAVETMFEEVGLGERLTHRPAELSGGEQQRVALVRALMNDPELILGDEPTGNLDSQTGERILDRLIGLNRTKGKTLVIVSHDPRIAARADQIIAIKDGSPVRNHVRHSALYASI